MANKIFATKDPAITPRELAHRALSRSLASECVVLLENDGTLPLPAGGKLALFGNGARHTVRGGTGSGDVNTRSDVNIEQGLENAGFTLTTKAWMDRQDTKRAQAKLDFAAWIPEEAKRLDVTELFIAFSHPFQVPPPADITEEDLAAADSDTAIYVIARTAGEGADRWNKRGDYLLFEEEKAQLELLGERFKKLIVVLNVGGVMDMTELLSIKGINAVVLMSQLGNIGGDVIADVLTGRANPSGKLTDTWARRYEDYPSSAGFSHNDGNDIDEYYTEGIYVGYRYFDTFGVEPIYPFGFGRSYTTFAVTPGAVRLDGETVSVDVTVTNTGMVTGKEVVQLYVSAPTVDLPKPYQELICFAKTDHLSPGASQKLTLTFKARQMASYDPARAAWVLEPGDYRIRVGSSSRDTRIAAVVRLTGTVITEKAKNLFPVDAEVREITPPRPAEPETFDAPVLFLLTGEVPTREITYSGERAAYTPDKTEPITAADVIAGRATVEELVAQLSVEDLAEYCVGTARMGDGGVLGGSSYTVPGAAGDTSSIHKADRGIINMILADGPAGLRLTPVFKTDKEGNLLPGGSILGDMVEPFDPKYTDENSDTYYQYCTAIPIGWALAQSWNMPLLEQIGSMIGTEMEIFGVDLWLAPAMNIHRNPLCGRNFEYYSEDPVVSGKAAAAITLGVQAHPGKGTTIKHFAANSQEDNRYFTNSRINERAIREIYLKGFEITVKESQPLSIMTSYNLLNGIHTANSYDLIQAACRDEWGFKGVIMTDWTTSQYVPMLTGPNRSPYPISASSGCIAAGNDLQMPGCQQNVDDIVKAVKTGEEVDGYRITLGDLQFNAANILRVAIRIAGAQK